MNDLSSASSVSSQRDLRSVSSVSSVLCPVPLYFLRKFNRGFNQAERLAFLLSERTGIPMRNLLVRTRWTGRQTGRNREERLSALAGAFRVRGGKRLLLTTRIILVDDIMTTGATLQECARVLNETGAKQVEGLVIAHG